MADFNEDVFFASVTEVNKRLTAGEFNARELTRAFCDRLETLGPRYNALVNSMRRRAMNKAGDVDTDIGRERFRGPLQGIPYGAKDLLSATGTPTTWGTHVLAKQEFDYDATVIRKLDGVGAILTGKLSMLELSGAGGFSAPAASATGPGRNPWDQMRWSGSSSGSAVAVAAGLVGFALASETSDSIIAGSAYCGVTGLRPTYGYVSRYGAMPLSWTMDKIGPMCRSAEDCGLVLEEISGGDSEDTSSAGKRFYYTPQFVRRFSEISIGYSPSDFEQRAAEHTRPVFQQALETLLDIGFRVQEVALPDFPYSPVVRTICNAEAAAAFESFIDDGKVDQLIDGYQISRLKTGLEIPAKDYFRAMRIRSLIQQELRKMFVDVSILVTPSCLDIAPPVNEGLGAGEDDESVTLPRGLSCLNLAANLAGLPALSIPCGFVNGLPLGLNLVGRPFYENTLIAAGREFQNRTDWHRRRPPV